MSLFKKLFKALLVLLVLVIILLAVYLVPAHLQVRSVAPELPSNSELLALIDQSASEQGPSKVSYILTSSQALSRGQISHISIIVEWADGRLFMIDAGMDNKGANDFSDLLKKVDSTATDAQVHGDVGSLLKNDIQQVQGVGFTHLHVDHTQGLKRFCESRGPGAVGVQLITQANLHNFNTEEGANIVRASCLQMREYNGENLVQFDGFPGIGAFALGGHTPGSTLWAVALADKVLLFSGDITNDKASIDHNKSKEILYSYLLVPENVNRTAEVRKWLLNLDKNEKFSVIVSHDLANTKKHLPVYQPK